MFKLLFLTFLLFATVFTEEKLSDSFTRLEESGRYVIHRKEQKSSGGSVATFSGRGPPPLALFPLPNVFWFSPNIVSPKNHTIATFNSGSAP